MLMKIKSTEEIFGMYISSVWSNNTARQHDSFMFSFGEGRETRTPVLSRVRAAGYDLALQRGQERGLNGQKRKHGKIIVEIKFAVIPSILIQL
ncbi:21001_t:CDS:2 [Rhizophagus irregularis]|nr:21001_t:CDS:2 [Rhizophagus irregularis]